jgi:hypothetical protein
MNQKRVSFIMISLKHIIAPLLGLASLSSALSASAEPISTTAGDLLRAPTQFDEKRVFVIGYYVGSFGESRLFANAEEATRVANDVWIDQSVWANPADIGGGVDGVGSLTKHYVQLIGTFRYSPTNMGGSYAITNVTYFRRLSLCCYLWP